MDDKGYWILLICTNIVLVISFIISIQQICVTDNFKDKPRLRRTSLVSVNIFSWTILNSLVYLTSLYPDHTVFFSMKINTLSILIEAFSLLLGFHTFVLMVIYIIEIVYNSTSIRAPKWFTYILNVLEAIHSISVLICYTLYCLFQHNIYIYQYYIILMSLSLLIAFFIIMLLQRPIRILNEVQTISDNNAQQIASGKMYLKAAMSVAIFVCFLTTADLLYNFDYIYRYIPISCNFTLITQLLHSVILIVFSFCLILWIYKPKLCCTIPEDSVCEICFCHWCAADIDDFSDLYYSKNKNGPILLHESTATSINTNKAVTVTTMNDSQNIDTLRDLNKQIQAHASTKTV